MEEYFAIGCIWLAVGLCSKSNYVGFVSAMAAFATLAITLS